MSANSRIEWTDHTFNPWIGCTKVSPACDHCYAERSTPSRTLAVIWGPGQERQRTSPANWALPLRWNRQADAFMAQHGRRQRVFCASLADVFDNEVPPDWRADLFELVRMTPNLDWLLLTKRIGNVERMLREARDATDFDKRRGLWLWLKAWENGEEIPPHVWLGATICNQTEADRDIDKLEQVPARVHFLSIEPLLGPIDMGLCDCDHGSLPAPNNAGGVTCPKCNGTGGHRVDWVIVGGESGAGARPMRPDWARSLRDQCVAAGVPFLFKQWGEFRPYDGADEAAGVPLATSVRVGKKAAGRELDGRTWDEVPA